MYTATEFMPSGFDVGVLKVYTHSSWAQGPRIRMPMSGASSLNDECHMFVDSQLSRYHNVTDLYAASGGLKESDTTKAAMSLKHVRWHHGTVHGGLAQVRRIDRDDNVADMVAHPPSER